MKRNWNKLHCGFQCLSHPPTHSSQRCTNHSGVNGVSKIARKAAQTLNAFYYLEKYTPSRDSQQFLTEAAPETVVMSTSVNRTRVWGRDGNQLELTCETV